jgi:hypothetical protein
MNKIFNDAGIFHVNNGRPRVRLEVGGKSLTMCLLTGLEGSQPYRTQFDVALDHTAYTLGAGKGLGSETFGLIDGPFECFTEADVALQKLQDIQSLKERKVTITLNHGSGSIQFKGLLNRFTFKLDDSLVDGAYYIVTAVEAVGVWS